MRRRILLADDSVTIQKVIELTFMDEDYEVRRSATATRPSAACRGRPGLRHRRRPHAGRQRLRGLPALQGAAAGRAGAAPGRHLRALRRGPVPRRGCRLVPEEAVRLAGAAAARSGSSWRGRGRSGARAAARMQNRPRRAGARIARAVFELEAEAEAAPFSAGSEFSLEEPVADPAGGRRYSPRARERSPSSWRPGPRGSHASGQRLRLRAASRSPAAPRSAGFELPLRRPSAWVCPWPRRPSWTAWRRWSAASKDFLPERSGHLPTYRTRRRPTARMAGRLPRWQPGRRWWCATGRLSDADVDRIARRLVELLGDKAVRDVAWEVIPDSRRLVIKDRLRELESQAE